MKIHQIKTYDKKRHNFQPVVKATQALFGDKLQAIFIHGSLFDGTFGKYSDYDIVIILDSISGDVLKRDDFAQKLKMSLINNWKKNPCSFDFYGVNEIQESAKVGHPFVKSILNKGCPIFDPKGIFKNCFNALPDRVNSRTKLQMAKNLVFLADKNIEISKKLLAISDLQFALLNVSAATTFIIRACLVLEGHNIYQGEIYQFFLKIFNGRIPINLANDLWKYAFKSNQISFRLKEPHIDIPLQNTAHLFKKVHDKELVLKMIEIYNKLKKFKNTLE